MKLTNKEDMSNWAFFQCHKGNDTQEMRDLISHPYWAYRYCRYIMNIKEMWIKIKESYSAYYYCIYVENKEEVRKHINIKFLIDSFKNRIDDNIKG